jgi:hypothetical protein
MSWLWWNQGAEIAALHTDLDAAYAEVETLRARPAVVSPAAIAPMDNPASAASAGPNDDPNAVVPAPDAPDAATASSAAVELVPANSTPPPAPVTHATAPAAATHPAISTSGMAAPAVTAPANVGAAASQPSQAK